MRPEGVGYYDSYIACRAYKIKNNKGRFDHMNDKQDISAYQEHSSNHEGEKLSIVLFPYTVVEPLQNPGSNNHSEEHMSNDKYRNEKSDNHTRQ